MSKRSKSRRNAFFVSVFLIVIGVVMLIDAYAAYKDHRMVPSLDNALITPAQAFVVAGLFLMAGAYALARALFIDKADDR